MASSATPEAIEEASKGDEVTDANLQNESKKQANTALSEPKEGQKNKAKGQQKPQGSVPLVGGVKDAKPSGKELKERAKAEKAAKRAREKQERQGQPVQDLQGGNKAPEIRPKVPQAQSPANAVVKPQQRRKSSAAANAQKPLALRPAEPPGVQRSQEPKREDKRVALLEHLYGPPRRTTIAGASKDIHPAILALGLQIGSYEICGSSARCVAMLLVFKQVIASYTTPGGTSLPRHLTTHLSSQIDYLVSFRPLSTSQGNAIRWLKVAISAVDVSTPEQQAINDLCTAIDDFIRERITVADQVIVASAVERIKDGDIIMTFAKSSIVEKALAEAFRRGRKFRVIVIDSRPLFEGRNLATALAGLGVEVEYSLTNGLSHVVQSATKVFLGAHAMMSNGHLYSRIGTALVAMSAKNARIPVVVCCESVKLTDRVALDSFVHNEIAPEEELLIPEKSAVEGGKVLPPILEKWREVPNLQLLNLMYDLTPAEFIDMVITEYGSLPPGSVMAVQQLSTNT